MQEEKEQSDHRFAAHPSLLSGVSPQKSDFRVGSHKSMLKLPENGESLRHLPQPLKPQISISTGVCMVTLTIT